VKKNYERVEKWQGQMKEKKLKTERDRNEREEGQEEAKKAKKKEKKNQNYLKELRKEYSLLDSHRFLIIFQLFL
jgi:hypothetical protein